jgi:hypothetical protein
MAKIRLKRKGLSMTGGTLYQPGRAPSAPRAPGVNFATSPHSPLPRPMPVRQPGVNLGAPPTTHQQGQNVGAPAPAPQQPGQNAGAPPAPQMPPVPVADSEYYGWLAQRQGEVNQQQIAWDAEDQNDVAARNEALRRMAQQRPEDLLTANRNFNRQGLFYSGALGKQRGDIEADYVRQESDTRSSYQRAHDAREAARQALLSGFSLEQAAQMAAAADRQAQRDADSAAMGGLAGPADPTSAPATGQPGPSGTLVAHPGVGQNFSMTTALRKKARRHGGAATHRYGR